jgi:Cohesin domain.
VVKAATFSFDKSSYSVSTGQTVQVQININTGTDQVNGADAYINYDNSFLSVENVTAGSFFPSVIHDTGMPGIFSISGMVEEQANPKTGSGTLATITFKGLKNGTTSLKFDCNNSKIVKNDVNVTNILQCSSDDKAVISVGSGSGGDSSSSLSNSSSSDQSNSSNNNQPQTLPKSGIFEI